MLGGAADLSCEILALVGQRGKKPAAALIEHAGHFGCACAHRSGNFIGLANEGAHHFRADAKQSTFNVFGILLQRAADNGRKFSKPTLGDAAAILYRNVELLDALDATVEIASDFERAAAERALDVLDLPDQCF